MVSAPGNTMAYYLVEWGSLEHPGVTGSPVSSIIYEMWRHKLFTKVHPADVLLPHLHPQQEFIVMGVM